MASSENGFGEVSTHLTLHHPTSKVEKPAPNILSKKSKRNDEEEDSVAKHPRCHGTKRTR